MVTYIYAISKAIGENKHMDQEGTPLLIERKNIQPVLTASGRLFSFIHAAVILCFRAIHGPRKDRLPFWGKPGENRCCWNPFSTKRNLELGDKWYSSLIFWVGPFRVINYKSLTPGLRWVGMCGSVAIACSLTFPLSSPFPVLLGSSPSSNSQSRVCVWEKSTETASVDILMHSEFWWGMRGRLSWQFITLERYLQIISPPSTNCLAFCF